MAAELPEQGLSVDHEGQTYTFRVTDFTGQGDLDFYKATGVTITDVFASSVTLFTIAGLVWLTRRRKEPAALAYEAVNKAFTYTNLATVRDEAGEAIPEA